MHYRQQATRRDNSRQFASAHRRRRQSQTSRALPLRDDRDDGTNYCTLSTLHVDATVRYRLITCAGKAPLCARPGRPPLRQRRETERSKESKPIAMNYERDETFRQCENYRRRVPNDRLLQQRLSAEQRLQVVIVISRRRC